MNLLHAEDNLPDAMLVEEAIRTAELPLKVFLCQNGEEALDFITKAHLDPTAPRPDIFVLDLNLPRIDGFELLRRTRALQSFQYTPALLVTSTDSQADREEAARLGAVFFPKPISLDEFLKIGDVLRQVLADNHLLEGMPPVR
jgi:CheY-like chemotaxis protein